MLTRTNAFVRCCIPEDERQILIRSLDGPWKSIYVMPMESQITDEFQVNRVFRMLVDANSKVMLWMTSEDVEFKWEIFRLSVSSENELVDRGLINGRLEWESPVVNLNELPNELAIETFLNCKNEISLIRTNGWYEIDGKKIIEIKESGLLVANTHGRLLLFDPEDSPLDFCITTKKTVIDSVLKDAEIIPLLSA